MSVTALRSVNVSFATNQLLFALLGAVGFAIVSATNFSWWWRTRWIWYLGCLALLALTLIVGTVTNGSLSWIRLGSYRFQASEFMKPALLLVLAEVGRGRSLRHWREIIVFGLTLAMPVGLIMLQPDLGTTLTLLAGAGTIFLWRKPRKSFVLAGVLTALIVGALAWILWLKPYQKNRILAFWKPELDPLGSSYNARQAMIAVGSGGVWGRGLGGGLQSHLRFLPERQTDFLFATYAEETGWIGSALLVSLYTTLFLVLLFRAQQSASSTHSAFLLGITATLLMQTIINIGMNIGVMPVTGVTLPLFSLGGSSLLSTALSLGLIESLRRSQLESPKLTGASLASMVQ